jgi:hypothetical protein
MKNTFLAAILLALSLARPACAYPVPLPKEECQKMEGTAWDDAQGKCVWNPLVKEGCERLAGAVWDQEHGTCVRKESKYRQSTASRSISPLRAPVQRAMSSAAR